MTGRDRTAEFTSVVHSLQSYHAPTSMTPHPRRRQSEIMAAAKKIGYDINCTSTKLEKLTELARGRSLFGDPTADIQELTQVIKQDLSKLNSDISSLQQQARAESYGDSKHMRTHTSSVVISLQVKLANVSQDFKSVLELRTENLKQQKQRREQFSASPVTSSYPPMERDGMSRSVLLSSDQTDSHVGIDMDSLRRQQQMQVIEQQDAYIQERSDAMENIHSTIVELGTIFRQLAEMVQQQEEQVARIDDNVEETLTNVDAAHTELLKYFKGITSNRWLMLKIFGVILVFFIFFVVFFV
ncbi:Syntaxin-5 [Geodia barretti]|uniref:Syntaxin-5 n=1 Tax=Geodia barretti TaxID=519541 RepID=A0AA35SXA9_GEOBA|nr:Syntaxin-5 [Geodia barretti]